MRIVWWIVFFAKCTFISTFLKVVKRLISFLGNVWENLFWLVSIVIYWGSVIYIGITTFHDTAFRHPVISVIKSFGIDILCMVVSWFVIVSAEREEDEKYQDSKESEI